jgi:hypothetical protein
MKFFLLSLKILLLLILFFLLTLSTQVGGVILLLSFCTHRFINRRTESKLWRGILKTSGFLILYFLFSLLVLPPLASAFGRVPLPVFSEKAVKPLRAFTWILNRHYARKEIHDLLIRTAGRMQQIYPGATINYLEAGFPLIDGFPLYPHRSHDDGKKIDLSFFYLSSITGFPVNEAPSPIGYGICEEPGPAEMNMPALCASGGHWQYSFMKQLIPQSRKKDFVFDNARTKAILNLMVIDPGVDKIFLEPHLKNRLGLTSKKIRFHGCSAVRHNDHFHVQMK